ncbi:uncharacterized protein [Apostichopus japonicus]|uniref:uncharacterized protein isoform X2 n=1 Tax=Stichopus japonicus TaxID=307972 RepID=UPI003AB78320
MCTLSLKFGTFIGQIEIELIVQAEETEIKETKEESEDGEKIKTQKITTKIVTIHGDQPGTVETTTVSIVNGEKEDNNDRAPSVTPRTVRAWKFPPGRTRPLADQEEEEVPNAIILVKEEEGQKGGELEEKSLLLK